MTLAGVRKDRPGPRSGYGMCPVEQIVSKLVLASAVSTRCDPEVMIWDLYRVMRCAMAVVSVVREQMWTKSRNLFISWVMACVLRVQMSKAGSAVGCKKSSEHQMWDRSPDLGLAWVMACFLWDRLGPNTLWSVL